MVGLLWLGQRAGVPDRSGRRPAEGVAREPTPTTVAREIDEPDDGDSGLAVRISGVESPESTPTLERPELAGEFPRRAVVAAAAWRRVGTTLAASDQPDLRAVAIDLGHRLTRAAGAGLTQTQRADLIHEQRQLLNYLKGRYRGFADIEADLATVDEQVSAMDGASAH